MNIYRGAYDVGSELEKASTVAAISLTPDVLDVLRLALYHFVHHVPSSLSDPTKISNP